MFDAVEAERVSIIQAWNASTGFLVTTVGFFGGVVNLPGQRVQQRRAGPGSDAEQ
ncbi:hypothetical protein ACQP00_40680 [Dactylosporangium sp. CS-047395]|uniref:hypothetical protein n=1 Tax=Dactylosporangium sp. CS-047395 TaxID=3239936 RepID=UPI003D8E5835